MTVQTQPQLPGVSAIGRKKPPTVADPDVRIPVASIGVASAPAYASHAVGKIGQVMILDGIEIYGLGDSSKVSTGGSFLGIRKDRYDGNNAGIFDLVFIVHSWNLTNNTKEWFQWHIEKVGYGAKHEYYTASDGKERANAMGAFNFVNTAVADLESRLDLRYMGTQDAERCGLRKGAWGVSDGITGTNQVILPAPGVGMHYRIRTLLICAGGNADPTQRITLGDNATATSSPIKVWYCHPSGNESRIVQFLTDLDIPCGENQPVTLTFGAQFLARHSIVVGAEVAPIERQNFLSLTRAPQ